MIEPFVPYTKQQISQYLERIHCTAPAPPSLAALTELHRQHLLHIPYENLDLLNGVPLSLEPNALFQKIILHQRGGYCFELQGLFGHLLRSLGYSVTQYAGRFMDEPGIIQMRRHRILVVALDGGQRYVCDVGVRSESPRCPLALVEGLIQDDGISQYCYRRDPFYGWVLQQREQGKDWRPLLGFTEEVQLDKDFIMPSFYCEQHPHSTFNKYMKISLFTENSDLTLVGNIFQIYRGAKVVQRRTLNSNEEVISLLSKTFGILVPPAYQNFLVPL